MTRVGADLYVQGGIERATAIEEALGRKLTSFSVYEKLDDGPNWPTKNGQFVLDHGGLLYLDINCVRDAGGTKSPVSWELVSSGAMDALLDAWVDALTQRSDLPETGTRARPRPIITFEHEPNINNANQPKAEDYDLAEYPRLFAYVRNYFDRGGVEARWAFMPTVSVYGTGKYREFMPDPDLFDVMGADVYNHEESEKSFIQKIEPLMTLASSLEKRVLIGEFGDDHLDASHSQRLVDAANYFSGQAFQGRMDEVIAVNFNTLPQYGVVSEDGVVNEEWQKAVEGWD